MDATRPNNLAAAFTEDQVARLTGVTKRQLRYWASDGFYLPGIRVEAAPLSKLRLYSFRDLRNLKVLNALRNEAKITLQELRDTRDGLAHLGDDLWVKTTLYILGKRVVFDNPETGTKEEATTGQGVVQIPLRVVAGQIDEALREMRGRRPDTVGKVEQKRKVAQNQPVIAGTRIPVRSIQAFSKAGYSREEIRRQYPSLAPQDIEAALRYKDVA